MNRSPCTELVPCQHPRQHEVREPDDSVLHDSISFRNHLFGPVCGPIALPASALHRTLDPRGLLTVPPHRVEDGAAPGPDLEVAVLRQLFEPPVGLGDRKRRPRRRSGGRDLTALPNRLKQLPLPLLLGDPHGPALTQPRYAAREHPKRGESDQEHPGEPDRHENRERGRDPSPRTHLLHVPSQNLTPAMMPPITVPHPTPHV